MKAAVYNWFWHTMGGGERHSGMIAQLLSGDGADVDLIGYRGVDVHELGDYLGLNLSKVRMRVVPDRGDEALADLSAEYDLFINASHMSRLAPRARKNVYLCYFPTPFDHDLAMWQRIALLALEGWVSDAKPGLDWKRGWYPREGGRRGWNWTTGHGTLGFPPGPDRKLTFLVGRPGAPEDTDVSIVDDGGNELARYTASVGSFVPGDVQIYGSTFGTQVHIQSGSFVAPGADGRPLGVALRDVHLDGRRPTIREAAVVRFPWLRRAPRDLSFVRAYDRVLANSEYTQRWIRRLWGVGSDVLYPPIPVADLRPGQKEKRIIVVGRFFDPEYGHGKRQLELVQGFKRMVARGGLEDWSLDVVGGCEPSQEPYLDTVRAAAAGAPVGIHANVPRALLEELLSSASIFWSATGLGVDEERMPWTSEHFGITTVEAMAAGAVPVVIDKAGQREVVRDAVDGFRWSSREELETKTRLLVNDEALRTRMAKSAVTRAQDYSEEAFARRWRSILATVEAQGA